MRRLPVALALVTALLVVAPLAVAAGDLEDAERRVERLQGDLADVTAAYEHTWAEVESTKAEIEDLERRAAELEEEAAELEEALAERARTVFKRGATAELQTVLAAGGPGEALERAGLVSALQRRETAGLEEAIAARRALEQTEQLLEARAERLDRLQEELDAQSDQLRERLSTAEEAAQALRTREERRRTIQRGTQQGTYACIFDRGSFHFRDSWGEPRSGGRSHKGTDVFAPMDEPVYAFTDGVVQRNSRSSLGGIGLYLRGDDGNVYYYAHLSGIVDGVTVGRRVEAGDHVAYNGATGNADASAPHVHFELHPGGGAATNPYPWLAAACK